MTGAAIHRPHGTIGGATTPLKRPAISEYTMTTLRAPALCLVLALVAGPAAPTGTRAAETVLSDSTAKYFRELRRRGLYRLAESYSLERLARAGLSPAARADLTLELARTLAEHATVVGDPEQTELWNRSRSTLDEFLKNEPANPRRLLIETQAAILPAMIGHTRRWQAESQPYQGALAQQAAESLNTGVQNLRALDVQITERLRKPPAPRYGGDGELKPFELRSLAANVRFRLGSALLDLAHLHPADSPDRAALLLEARNVLKSVAESGEDSELAWMSRVAWVESGRLQGDAGRTLKELDALEKQSPPPDIADRLLAERIRTLIAQKKFDQAATLLADLERQKQSLPGELAFLAIQVEVARHQAQNGAADAPFPEPLKQALEERAARIRLSVGGYWSYRSDLLIRQVRDVDQYGAELATLAGKAQSEYSAGRLPEAVELYGQAAARAHRDKRAELAFQFAFTRASIEIKLKSWADAAADLVELAGEYPQNPKAPQAHLLAAYALGKFYDEKPTRNRREEYSRVLEEHRARYAGGPTAADAAWMLAELNERRGQNTVALDLYKSIPAAHKRGPTAQIAVARCFEKILERLRELNEPDDDWEKDAVTTLTKMLPAPVNEKSFENPGQIEVAVRLARILLHQRPPRFEAADRLLVRAAAALTPPAAGAGDSASPEAGASGADLRALARQLQVISLAGQGRFQDAREMLRRLSSTSPLELLRILDGIAPLQSDDRQDPFHDLGELQLEAALKLDEQRTQLVAADQRRLDECLARAYLATKQIQRGIEIYDRLIERSPRDKRLLTACAEILTKSGSKECLAKALAARRRLEGLEKEGSPDWFAARYQVCRALLALDDTREACKLIKVTRLLYPKVEGSPVHAKFAELEAQCAKGKARTKSDERGAKSE
jgi:tetratricopeptide (TPR) repeat protein/TolA-binding protein